MDKKNLLEYAYYEPDAERSSRLKKWMNESRQISDDIEKILERMKKNHEILGKHQSDF